MLLLLHLPTHDTPVPYKGHLPNVRQLWLIYSRRNALWMNVRLTGGKLRLNWITHACKIWRFCTATRQPQDEAADLKSWYLTAGENLFSQCCVVDAADRALERHSACVNRFAAGHENTQWLLPALLLLLFCDSAAKRGTSLLRAVTPFGCGRAVPGQPLLHVTPSAVAAQLPASASSSQPAPQTPPPPAHDSLL